MEQFWPFFWTENLREKFPRFAVGFRWKDQDASRARIFPWSDQATYLLVRYYVSKLRGGEGVKACANNADAGGVGVKNLGKLADVILEHSLIYSTPDFIAITEINQLTLSHTFGQSLHFSVSTFRTTMRLTMTSTIAMTIMTQQKQERQNTN